MGIIGGCMVSFGCVIMAFIYGQYNGKESGHFQGYKEGYFRGYEDALNRDKIIARNTNE